MENQKNNSTINHQLYELDKVYKSNTNLVNYIDEAQNFYNGNQYPNVNFNNMIRVSINICSFSATIKASKICGTPLYLTFTADNQKTDCIALRRFDEYNCSKMQLKENNYQSALNGFVNGTEITFIRWDDDDTTYKGIYKGGLVEEHIDIRNFAVANPYIQDIQNQKWVMFWEDYEIGALKELVEGKNKQEIEEKRELLEREIDVKDDDNYKDKDAINHALTRLYTRFFRIDGEVYFMCSTESVDLFLFPHPLSRKLSKTKIKKIIREYEKQVNEETEIYNENQEKVIDYKIDFEDTIINSYKDTMISDKEYKKIKEKFSQYPFAVFRPFAQNRSFYGRSDIKSLIPIQKGINFAVSMMLKCAENNAYNKIIVKSEALQGQQITNEPSQVLTDYSNFTNGWGIKFAESQPMPNGLLDFADRLLSMTRVVYGFNDVMDGSVTNQDMSGYMLQQMIKQSNTSIEQQQMLFWAYNEEKASIRLLFYKHYVDKAKYTYELSDADLEKEENARVEIYNKLANGEKLEAFPNAKQEDFETPVHKTQIRELKNEDIYGVNFDIAIDSMQGTQDSKLVEQQMWDNLLLNGGIQNISPDILSLYLQASPNVSQRTKDSLNRVIENLHNSTIQQQQAQITDLTQKLQQAAQIISQLDASNKKATLFAKNLQNEFTGKINNANKIIEGLTAELDKKSQGEVKSANARGVGGEHITETPVQ